MAYQRFILPVSPATFAIPATVQPVDAQSVAVSVNVAADARGIQQPSGQTVAELATVAVETAENAISTSSPERSVFRRQTDPSRCYVCDDPFTVASALIAVLTDELGEHHWLHHGCHDEHIRRCLAMSVTSARQERGSWQ